MARKRNRNCRLKAKRKSNPLRSCQGTQSYQGTQLAERSKSKDDKKLGLLNSNFKLTVASNCNKAGESMTETHQTQITKSDEMESLTGRDDKGAELHSHDFLGHLDLKPVCPKSAFTACYKDDGCYELDKETGETKVRQEENNTKASSEKNYLQAVEFKCCTQFPNEGESDISIVSSFESKESECFSNFFNLGDIKKENAFCGIQNSKKTLTHEVAEEKIIQRVQEIEQSYKHKINFSDDEKDTMNKKESTVIIFRDNNKKMRINSDGTERDDENGPDNLFDTLNASRSGRKRRYAKLMKRLEDTGKSIETNLKGVMVMVKEEHKGNVSGSMEKVKKKLCVRAKKKYESLINYQRIKANVEQKSFEDLLPEKVDLVKSNIVKEFTGSVKSDGVHVKKPRGRPRKIQTTSDVTMKEKEKSVGSSKKTKSKNTPVVRGFPRKFPRSLLQDSISTNVLKADKIRLGIIDKNGSKEVIELSNETLNLNVSNFGKKESTQDEVSQPENFPPENDMVTSEQPLCDEDTMLKARCQSESISTSAKDENECQKNLNSGNNCLGEPWLTSPPTTIRLPTISSLESDYELVSLTTSHPKKTGDFSKDQFFIPQSTFSKDGKKGMVIVGPFCVSHSPKPHLVLVPPKDHQKKEPMILKRKVSSPSKASTVIESAASQEGELTFAVEVKEENQSVDHNYCIPVGLQDVARRTAKGVAKHNAMARFIDARVESIQEGQGNSVVTIKGDNILKQFKNLPQQAAVPISTTKDGIPVVYNLTQITTPVLQRAEERAKREKMAEESQRSGDFSHVYYPLEVMGEVVMEVLIPPCGTEIVPRAKVKQSKGSEVLNSNLSACLPSQNQSFRVIGSMPGKSMATLLPSCGAVDEVSFLNDRSGGVIDLDGDAYSPKCPELMDNEGNTEGQEFVPIENELTLEGSPGLCCCRLCLRLFPTSFALFSHVRSIHATGIAEESVYLEELKARSKLPCPMCRPPVYFSTPLKLERHFQMHHSLMQPKEVCSYCLMEFSDVQELIIHLQLSHGIYTMETSSCALPASSKMKSHHGHMNSLKCKRSLLSDYLTCSRCNIMFDDRNSLVSHTLTVHPDLNQGNVCRLCEREFDTDQALRKHLRNSHEQMQNGALRCPYCPAWLSSMDEASVHKVTVHSGAVPVHCPFCGAGYQSVHPMYNHVRSQHLLTESHLCPECQVSFPSTRLLTDHARREHLMSARVIKDHIRSVRSASYCCPFCTISFTRTYDLAVHVVMNHKDPLLPAKCHFCMQAFVNQVIMKMHMAAAHAIHIDQHDDEREDLSFLPEGMEGDDAVTVVLEAGEEDGYASPSSYPMHSKNMVFDMPDMRHALMMDPRDVLETQEAVSYIENLDERDRETIVYLDDRNQVMGLPVPVGHDVPTGDMFDTCSGMSEGRLLDESLQAVDYLETLSNDRIAVAADVVADVIMDDIVGGERRLAGGRVVQVDDMLGLNGHFEVDGVLYEFAATQDDSRAMDLPPVPGDPDVDQITMDGNELGQFLRQQVH